MNTLVKAVFNRVRLTINNAISIHKALKNHQNICKCIRVMEVLVV